MPSISVAVTVLMARELAVGSMANLNIPLLKGQLEEGCVGKAVYT